jgi:uncharacterized membrane protein
MATLLFIVIALAKTNTTLQIVSIVIGSVMFFISLVCCTIGCIGEHLETSRGVRHSWIMVKLNSIFFGLKINDYNINMTLDEQRQELIEAQRNIMVVPT